jgi:3-isopropylmalate dehydrogenase
LIFRTNAGFTSSPGAPATLAGVRRKRPGAAPDIAGRGVANPVAMILPAAMLLDWLGGQRGDGRLVRGEPKGLQGPPGPVGSA